MAIVATLVALAYPSYASHLMKGRRAAAQSHLMELAQRQMQYLTDSRSYAPTEAALGVTAPAEVSSYYTIDFNVQAGPPPSSTITATPKAGTAQAGDVTLSIDQSGQKTPANKW